MAGTIAVQHGAASELIAGSRVIPVGLRQSCVAEPADNWLEAQGDDRYLHAMQFVGTIGRGTIEKFRRLRYLMAVLWAVWRLGAAPDSWRRTTRAVLARQIVFTGVDALGFVMFVAFLAGISIVVQAQVWMGRLGQLELLGPLLVTVVVREVGPLLVNFIVIGRSATATAAELAGMRVRHEVSVLDAQGVDPMVYLVMPRALGMAVCVLCLTVVFALVSFATGYMCGALLGTGPEDPAIFARSVLRGFVPGDFVNLGAKTILPGLMTSIIACVEGLSIEGVATDIPQAVTRTVVRSTLSLLILSVIVSVLTYA